MNRLRTSLLAIAITLAIGAPANAAEDLAVPKIDPQDVAIAVPSGNVVSATLPWDVTHAHKASEPTTASLATDGAALYVRFEATQRETIAASQHTNNVGAGSDDEVWIDLWPNGGNGYFYQFQTTPNGTHYESSSENTGYAPTWESHGEIRDGGYTATMKIPLNVIRGAHAGTWKVQFVRSIHATGEVQVWSYDAAQTNADDLSRAGSMTMPSLSGSTSSRPKPRLAMYSLGEAASKSIGGSTSRVGADLSIPITPTASFYSTFHPDYSNVELDQQSISPSVYARYYNEVRPFFTQGASFYGQFNCDACPQIQELYFPAIPTPREGYAVEGKQGPLSFASFDAIGDDRNDIASALDYESPDTRWNAALQRVSVAMPGTLDTVTTTGVDYYDLKHISAYFNYGSDSGGTNVLVPDQAQRYDFGGGWANQTFAFFGSARKVGEYYDPVDGFVSHPGIAGYALYSAKIWDFDANSKLAAVGIAAFADRYQGPTQGQAQSDNSLLLDVLTKSAWDIQAFTGSNYWRFDDTLTPVSQNGGFQITYHSGTVTNNPGNFPNHGQAPYPTLISYNTGRYGNGRLDTWFRSSTIRAGARGAVTVSLDDTAQWLPVSPANVQWFESLSYSYQISSTSSFAVGIRRVTGTPPAPNGGGDCIGTCSNISVAYHLKLRHDELYLAYGNPNTLTTVPQAIFKLIFYAGAEKGT